MRGLFRFGSVGAWRCLFTQIKSSTHFLMRRSCKDGCLWKIFLLFFKRYTSENGGKELLGAVELRLELPGETDVRLGDNGYYFLVDWGDGESDHSAAHHYEQAGYYRVRVVGTAISQLDVSKCHLTELKLDKCPLLENLNCAYNRLITLELVCCPKLKLLNCSGNRLSVLRSRCNRGLVYLDCSDNVLQSLELDACPDLLYLFCFSNRLHSLYLGGCDDLVCVDIGGNGFEAEALNQLFSSLPAFYRRKRSHYPVRTAQWK